MKVDRRLLSEALSSLVDIADPKAPSPILGHILLQSIGGTLTITATDGTTTVDHEMPAAGEISVTLPARLLHVLVRPEGRGRASEVEIEKLDRSHASVVVDGLSTKLATLDPADFPPSPANEALDWSLLAMCPAPPVHRALGYVLPAASNDEGRPHLNCVCFANGQVMATDGHRLHAADIPFQLAESMLLPLRAARTLKRLLVDREQVIFAKAKDTLRVRVGQWQMDTQLLDATFPAIEKVIPVPDQPVRITVQQALLTTSLARVAKLSKDDVVRLTINGHIQLTAENPDIGEAQVVVPVLESNHQGNELVTGFRLAYLRAATASKGETLELGLSGPTDALRVDTPGRLAVVMAMRL